LIFSWFALANIWLTFSIIIDLVVTQGIILFGTATVVSSSFYFCLAMLPLTTFSQTHWVNLAFKWIYLAFLALQFILALGNRPKGERLAYSITLWYISTATYAPDD
jgi:chitin synthase